MILFSAIRAKRCFDVQKKMTKLPELEGEGGVYLIRAMPERKRAFPYDVFPNGNTGCFLQLDVGLLALSSVSWIISFPLECNAGDASEYFKRILRTNKEPQCRGLISQTRSQLHKSTDDAFIHCLFVACQTPQQFAVSSLPSAGTWHETEVGGIGHSFERWIPTNEKIGILLVIDDHRLI